MRFVRFLTLGFYLLAISVSATTNILQVFNFDFGTAPSTHVDPTINVGDTVQWVWASGGVGHSTTAAAGQSESWNSGIHSQPFTFDHTFTHAGTFNYYCMVHGFDAGGGNVGGMSGHVVVLNPVGGDVIFFDDFQQFDEGTDLTSIDYFPPLGLSAEIQTNDDGFASTTVVASNLVGSTRAFFDRVTPPYEHKYRGDPTASLTNETLVLSWKLWIEAVKSPSTTLGGLTVDVLTTNIDFIDVSGTNYTRNPVMIFNDAGQILVFTNNPSMSDPLHTVVQVGTWNSLAGKVMTNQLVLDYPGGVLTFSLNNNTLTNMPIPQYITNIFDRVHFNVFEGFSSAGTLKSTGNRFALDDVQLQTTANSGLTDIVQYVAVKGQSLDQTNVAAPFLDDFQPFVFLSLVEGTDSNSVISATIDIPGGVNQELFQDSFNTTEFEFDDGFDLKPDLDAAYTNGTYTFNILAAHQGLRSVALNLPTDDYPSNPHISNWDAAQAIDSTADFTVMWDAFTGGTTNDFVQLSITDFFGEDVFDTPGHLASTNRLNGTKTSVVIPAGTLAPNSIYDASLLFVKIKTLDTNSIPGAVGATGYMKMNNFSASTLPPPGPACSLAPALATNDIGSLHTVTATVMTGGIAAAGITVNFNVTSGPNTGTNGMNVTDGAGHASFSYSGNSVGVDTIQAAGTASSMSFTCTATKVWLLPNVPPTAVCQNVTNAANASCHANVTAGQVDNGSSDPDGQIVSMTLSPPGPYNLGDTNVTLTVTDNRGGMDSCLATITVVDQTAPTITCPANIVTNVLFGTANAVVNYPAPTVSDNCSVASTNCVPPTGSIFSLGTNSVTCTAMDGVGNTNSCAFNVIVNEAPAEADLAVVKAASPNPVLFTSNVTYTITVANLGPNDATSATVTDALPSSVTFVSAGASQGSCTQIAGVVTCNLGTIASGSGAAIAIVVTPTVAGSICNTARVSSAVADPVAGNNLSGDCSAVEIHDLAVIKMKAPKKITFATSNSVVTATLSVSIQNRGPLSESIASFAALSNLVSVTVHSLGACPDISAVLLQPKTAFPITLAPKKKLTLQFHATYGCFNDPLATSKTVAHNDYTTIATVKRSGGDSDPGDDNCPHDAPPGGVDPVNSSIKDKGCGGKKPDGTLGAPVPTDVIVK